MDIGPNNRAGNLPMVQCTKSSDSPSPLSHQLPIAPHQRVWPGTQCPLSRPDIWLA